MVRNFRHANGSPPIPGRRDRYSTGPREEIATAIEMSSSSGLMRRIRKSAPTKSNVRLTA